MSRERKRCAVPHVFTKANTGMNSVPQEAPVEGKTLGMVKELLKKN